MKPKFNPDWWPESDFLGHWFGHDVYYLHTGDGTYSIVARHGDKAYEYGSCPVDIMLGHLSPDYDGNIGGEDNDVKWVMPYHEYLFSDRVAPYTKAMMMGLAFKSLQRKTNES